ncbi:PAS domain-containing sensor histidine kinase [Hymenobacter sp. YC55]|uniref:PAS domain-containing sensor histidine kinase n=1 Tax=Hymenobacter sp. YC55 TaxID=3034019 RepID=UPI0023F8CBAE|nr:PAS domain-containing sensor histidine kinase [Hymenobacter sp. YC55]MDF7815616.1 ATP-binding protein [Hymenobacter sp. YC55]
MHFPSMSNNSPTFSEPNRLASVPGGAQAVLHCLPGAVVVINQNWVVQLANAAAEQLFDRSSTGMVGLSLVAMLPEELVKKLRQAQIEAAGKFFTLEHYNDGPHKWLCWKGVSLQECVVLTVEDISAYKQAGQVFRQTHQQLEAIFDAIPAQLGYYEAVRDAQGRLIDLRSMAVNQASSTKMLLVGDSAGQLMSTQVPGLRELPVWQTIQQVIETGETQQLELQHTFGDHTVWFDVCYSRFGDGLINASIDITARKVLEDELRAGKAMLQAVFDSSTLALHVLRSIRDAEGRIVDFEVILANKPAEIEAGGPLVGKRMLVDWPHSRKVGLFDGIVRTVETGQALDLEHYYDGEGMQDWYRWTAVKLGDGVASTVENITARQQATAEQLRRERVQQQELANAVLEAQETERRRIAESLHNGLGQQLYAAQLHLHQLMPTAPPAAFAESMRQTQVLLQNAIRQARTLSHQLMPTVLEDFGLTVALRDISQNFTTPQLRFTTEVETLPELPPTLQLALYRMAQELANNVVKHASATDAVMQLRAPDGWLELEVKDNGLGFDPAQRSREGLGLQLLTDRVQLLGGQLTVISSPESGTQVQIRIPRQAHTAAR